MESLSPWMTCLLSSCMILEFGHNLLLWYTYTKSIFQLNKKCKYGFSYSTIKVYSLFFTVNYWSWNTAFWSFKIITQFSLFECLEPNLHLNLNNFDAEIVIFAVQWKKEENSGGLPTIWFRKWFSFKVELCSETCIFNK